VVQRNAVSATLIDKRDTLNMKLALKKGITGSKIKKITGSGATEKMSEGHDEPKTLDAGGGTDLILVESQNIFGLAKKDLDGPTIGVNIKDLISRQGSIGGDESA